MLSASFFLFLLCQVALAVNDCSQKTKWDFIIVGAGPGGSAAAAYLHEYKKTKYNVLLVERGRDHNAKLDEEPYIRTYLAGGDTLWSQEDILHYVNTNPLNGGGWPQIRTLGGQQAVNAGVYSPGHSEELADIFRVPAATVTEIKTWIASHMKPYFPPDDNMIKQHATNLGVPYRGADPCTATGSNHGTGPHPSMAECDFPSQGCMHSYRFFDKDLGAGLRRTSFYKSYFHDQGIKPDELIRRAGSDTKGLFKIKTNAMVTSLNTETIEGKKQVVSLTWQETYGSDGSTDYFCLSDRGKVILSAGPFETPALLLRSGITAGGAVGANLHEHGLIAVASKQQPDSIFTAINELKTDGTASCPHKEAIMYFNGGGEREASVPDDGVQKFEIIYYVDCNNCLSALYALWMQNDKRGSVTINNDGNPRADYGWDYSVADRTAMSNALKYFRDNSGISFDCDPTIDESFNEIIDVLENESNEDAARYISKAWHASGTCAAKSCFNDRSGIVKETSNVYVGDVSTFPDPITAHLSVPSNIAGTIAAYKAAGSDRKGSPFYKKKCSILDNGLIDASGEIFEGCQKAGNQSTRRNQANCAKHKKDNVEGTYWAASVAHKITNGYMTRKLGMIQCNNGMVYHVDDICERDVTDMKANLFSCDCPMSVEKSSLFFPPPQALPQASAVDTILRAELADHAEHKVDCWAIIWPWCQSQEDLCAQASDCGEDKYFIVQLAQPNWNHPGGQKAMKNACGREVFDWLNKSDGHPTARTLLLPKFKVPAKLSDLHEEC